MKFAVTCGDVGGIGPEIVLKAIEILSHKSKNNQYIISIPGPIHDKLYSRLNLSYSFQTVKKLESFTQTKNRVVVLDTFRSPENYPEGVPSKESGKLSYKSIVQSYLLCNHRLADALVTAPISKTALHLAQINFPGHTEMLAEFSRSKEFGMFFLAKNMRAALFTIHLPLEKVPEELTKGKLKSFLLFSRKVLKTDFGILNPRIAVLGLNPHAGEDGLLGRQEIKIISPLIKQLGESFYGPFVPDAFFGKKLYSDFDLVIGMYHDQVLIPFKMLNYSTGVNYTAGLNIIRTSPDHGTAYDIAGKYIADPSSMLSAFYWAEKIFAARKRSYEKA